MTYSRRLPVLRAVAALVLLGGCADPDGRLRLRIDRGLENASAYLVSHQDEDGAWRSATYGTLADGISLTPAVMKTVLLGPPRDGAAAASAERAAAYLRGWIHADGSVGGGTRLAYPVYSSSLAVITLNRMPGDENRVARDAWRDELTRHQLTERLGWRPDDPGYGGWGYSIVPPRRPGPGEPPPPFASDLSSTLFAVGALRLTGAAEDDDAIRRALVFVDRCQNFAGTETTADPAYDDGGFFFTPSRAAQNKAGAAGTDRHGRLRYHSYGSATADGLRALLRCGVPPDHPRVRAARRWLERHFTVETTPGIFHPVREVDREAPYYYYCWSLAHALRLLDVESVVRGGRAERWAPRLAEALLRRQHADGSWRNDHGFVKEDDPLIATSLAAAALANCRQAMWGEIDEP